MHGGIADRHEDAGTWTGTHICSAGVEHLFGDELPLCQLLSFVRRIGDAYVLSSPRWYNLPRAEIVAELRPIIALRNLRLSQKRIIIHALLIYYQYPHLDFEDALSVALMQHNKLTELVRYDTDFDAIPGITREEPA
jgi:predicted nucleic acid-binding protein